MTSTQADRRSCSGFRLRPGLTLMELMVVMGIISVLLMIAVPALYSLAPMFQLRGSARGTATAMGQARLMATNYQKPVRLVMDCRDRLPDAAASRKPCIASLYVAVFDETQKGDFKEWRKIDGNGNPVDQNIPESGSRLMGKMVNIQPTASPASVPVTDNPTGLFWVVFYPSGRTAASHVPLALDYTAKGVKSNWRLSLSNASGQVTVKKTL